MTGINLIVAAPWIAFGAALATICWPLVRSRRASWRGRGDLARLSGIRAARCLGCAAGRRLRRRSAALNHRKRDAPRRIRKPGRDSADRDP
jgi:hypothetical protein